MSENRDPKKAALYLVILFGFVSLFGDIVYEGARSVNGPYLETLGTKAAIVGLIAGIGEFLGYALRFFSGYFVDRVKAYWFFAILGYGMLVSVPLLSLAGTWQVVALLIVAERIGKAIRSPARDTILSQATKQIGTGFGFGLHEAMDQVGAIAGPLIFTFVFLSMGSRVKTFTDYQHGYGFLWIPFVIVMLCVFWAYRKVPNPERLEKSTDSARQDEKLSKLFWVYTLFTFVTTLGFVNFVIMGYHFKAQNVLTDAQIPLFYAVAMAIDGVVALGIGKIYDRLKQQRKNEKAGILTLVNIPIFSFLIPLLAFSRNMTMVMTSILLWGVVMGIHETVMRSTIADIVPLAKRGTAYGIFNASYGIAMFVGSGLMGVLYDYSMTALVAMAALLEIVALGIFFWIKRTAFQPA